MRRYSNPPRKASELGELLGGSVDLSAEQVQLVASEKARTESISAG